MDNTQLQIVIKAVDEASAVLKQVSDNTAQAGSKITESTQSATSSFGNMFKSMLSADVAFEALRTGFEAVKGFIEGSIEAAVKESATMAQVRVDVENAGLSYAKFGPQIEEVGKQHMALGFAADDTQLSLGKLMLATGNYGDALKLNQLAMDLSRAKNIDLNSATVLVQQVIAGNTRVLKQYGISLDSATTSGEALNILHDKLKGSASAFGDTAAGKAAEVSAQWEKMQEDVGTALMPVLIKLFDIFEKNLPAIEDGAIKVADGIIKVANGVIEAGGDISKMLPYVEDLVAGFVAYEVVTKSIVAASAIQAAMAAAGPAIMILNTDIGILTTTTLTWEITTQAAFGVIGIAVGVATALIVDSANKLKTLNSSVESTVNNTTANAQKLADAYNKVHKTKLTADDFGAEELKKSTNWLGITSVAVETHSINTKRLQEAQKLLAAQTDVATDSTKKSGKAVDDAGMNFDKIPNKIKGATTAMVKHKDAVAQLSVEYNKMTSAGKTDLATLADSFNDKMKSINASIASTRQSIADLTESYNRSTSDSTAGVADQVVASENKIADLKKQLLTSTNAATTQSLQDQLKAEQANYDSSAVFRAANATAIATAEARAKETDLQRTIDDYTVKQALAAEDYQKQLAQLNQQLVDKQNEAASEQALYNAKVAAINKIQDDANKYFVQLSKDRLSQTTDEVNAEIKMFQDLAAAISQTKSASASAVATIKVPSIPVAKHESGGFVDAPRGTAVPIIAHGGEMVIPAEQSGRMGGGSNVYININNPSVRNDMDIVNLRKQIDSVMRPLLQNVKIAHS